MAGSQTRELSRILDLLKHQQSGRNPAVSRISRNPALVDSLLEGLGSSEARVKFGCAKALHLVSEQEPSLLVSRFDRFVALLGSANAILKWEAIRIIANLSRADTEGRTERIIDAYLAPIRGPVLITAANTIKGASTIARAKPHLADKITSAFLQVERARYRTAECRNIALGQVVEAFDRIFDLVTMKSGMFDLVARQRRNRRNATKRKAERFLRRHTRPV